MSNLVGNEQAKLTATYVNGIAVALFAVGGVAPVANFVAGTAAGNALLSVLFFIGCACLSAALHYVARSMLRRLKQ